MELTRRDLRTGDVTVRITEAGSGPRLVPELEPTAEFAGRPVTVPTCFLYGDRDPDLEGFSGRAPIGTMRAHVPGLRRVDEVAGAGHQVPLERAEQVNALLPGYLAELCAPMPAE